jgi:mRNA interferase MazF
MVSMMQIKRGDIWTGVGRGDYAGKPRPMLILESEEFYENGSDIVALITSEDELLSDILRYKLKATAENGLGHDSFVCLDKMAAISVTNLRTYCGKVSDEDMFEVEKRIARILRIRKEATYA